MATHSSILARRIPWAEEPGGLWSTGLPRAGRDCITLAHMPFFKIDRCQPYPDIPTTDWRDIPLDSTPTCRPVV